MSVVNSHAAATSTTPEMPPHRRSAAAHAGELAGRPLPEQREREQRQGGARRVGDA